MNSFETKLHKIRVAIDSLIMSQSTQESEFIVEVLDNMYDLIVDLDIASGKWRNDEPVQ